MKITEISWSYEQVLKDIPNSKFNWKPTPKEWSVAETIDHVMRVNRSYFPTFDQIIAHAHKPPLLGRIPFLGRKTGELILKSMYSPSKTKTFPVWKPAKSLIDPAIIRRFLDLQHELSAYIQKLEPYFGNDLMIKSPASPWVVYTLDQTIPIILAHEERHLKQVKNIINQ